MDLWIKTWLYFNVMTWKTYISQGLETVVNIWLSKPLNDKRSMEIKDAYRVHYVYYLALNVFSECETRIWSNYLHFFLNNYLNSDWIKLMQMFNCQFLKWCLPFLLIYSKSWVKVILWPFCCLWLRYDVEIWSFLALGYVPDFLDKDAVAYNIVKNFQQRHWSI